MNQVLGQNKAGPEDCRNLHLRLKGSENSHVWQLTPLYLYVPAAETSNRTPGIPFSIQAAAGLCRCAPGSVLMQLHHHLVFVCLKSYRFAVSLNTYVTYVKAGESGTGPQSRLYRFHFLQRELEESSGQVVMLTWKKVNQVSELFMCPHYFNFNDMTETLKDQGF